MFGLARNLYKYLRKRQERLLTLVLVGLDNAGKSTMLLALQGESTDNVTTTWGFARESLVDGACKLDIYDLGGGKNIRKIWERYYAEVHGVLFCVDAADKERLEEAKGELHAMVGVSHVAGKAVLIFANKQDLPHAMGVAEVAAALDLASIPNLRYQVVACVAKTAAGADADPALRRGLRWLREAVESDFAKLGPRVQAEAAQQAEQEARKVAERKARVEAQRAERKRLQEEEEAAEAAAAAAEAGEAVAEPATPGGGASKPVASELPSPSADNTIVPLSPLATDKGNPRASASLTTEDDAAAAPGTPTAAPSDAPAASLYMESPGLPLPGGTSPTRPLRESIGSLPPPSPSVKNSRC